MTKLSLVNIHNKGRKIYLFVRDFQGNLTIQEDNSFFPYYYEICDTGNCMSFDGKRLKKLYTTEPKEVAKIRTKEAYEADIIFTRRYLIDKLEEITSGKIKYAFIDIEVLADELPKVQDAKYPISCISIYNSFTNQVKTFFLADYKDEKALHIDFLKYMQIEKFDLWLSWNVKFDYNYLFYRIPDFDKLISPLRQSRYGDGEVFYPAGIAIIDYLAWFKKVTLNKEKSYALDEVAQKYFQEKAWGKTKFGELSEDIKNKNINDVIRMSKLEAKFKLIPYFDEIRRLSKTDWEDLIWNSRIVDSLLLQEARNQKIVLPMKPKDNEKEEFEGAYREAYEIGAHFGIGKYDLSSAYPFAIINFCLDPANISTADEPGAIKVDETYFAQNETALLPTIVKRLVNLKNQIKQKIENTDLNDPGLKDLKTKYDAIKAVVNSTYGSMAMQYFRLYNRNVASATTYLVRDLLHYVKDNIEAQGQKVIYVDTDSVPKDTPITIKNKNNEIEILPIEDLFVSPRTNTRSRYDITKKDYKVLTEKGWSKVKYIYRHKTKKTMYRILTRTGYIELSEDHSLVLNGKSISPKSLKIGDTLEQIPYKLENNLNISVDLAWLIGFWLAEGSCGKYRSIDKISWHIDQKTVPRLEKCKTILKNLGISTKIIDCTSSSGCYRLVADGNTVLLYEIFSHWCLTKSGDKKIPSFILNSIVEAKQAFLDGYWEGDGSVCKTDNISRVCSIDKSLLKGVADILTALGKEYSLTTRPDKLNVISLRIIRDITDTRVRLPNKIVKIETYINTDNIYDIETENHHFCGGFGNILLHNSVFIQSDVDLTDQLNKLVQEWALQKYGKESVNIEFAFEGVFERLLILAKCRYIGYRRTKKGLEEEIKGVEVKRKDSTAYMRIYQRTLIDKILNKESKEDIYKWIRNEVENFKNLNLADIAIPCKLAKDPKEYKNVPIIVRALKETEGFKKKVGDSFYYIYVEPESYEIEKEVTEYSKEIPGKKEGKTKKQKLTVKELSLIKDLEKKILSGEIKKETKIKTETKYRDVKAFDEETVGNIVNVDYIKMINRNIWNKTEVIFKAMGWNLGELNPDYQSEGEEDDTEE